VENRTQNTKESFELLENEVKILVSFSGGRTSAYMGWWLKYHTDHELKFVFMNTGCEHPATLEFLNECDRRWNLDLIWLEAVVNHEGKGHGFGTRHKVVDFKTAARDGAPMEDTIKKYGIPNPAFPHCTRETKLHPFKSYVRDNDLNDWATAIGIRSDEFDRANPKHKELNIIYPLLTMNPTNEDSVR